MFECLSEHNWIVPGLKSFSIFIAIILFHRQPLAQRHRPTIVREIIILVSAYCMHIEIKGEAKESFSL